MSSFDSDIEREAREVFWEHAFEPNVPLRYRRLIREVAEALPHDWDDQAVWTVTADADSHSQGYANVLCEEDAGEMVVPYVITIFPALLDRVSDSACRWVFAHEFAHIASKLRSGSIFIEGKRYTRLHDDEYVEAPAKNVHETAADRIALEWGFGSSLQAFLDEDSKWSTAGGQNR